MKKKLISILLCAGMVISLAGCGETGKEEKAENEAKKGETLTIYTNSGSDGRGEWLEEKAKEAGFDIQFIDAGAAETQSRLIAEKNAPVADVVFGLYSIIWSSLKSEDILTEYVPKWAGEVESELNDPDGFYLTRRVDALGTYDAYRKFHVGESGMPVAENDVYTKVNVCDSKEDEAALVSTRELPVTMMEADGSEKEEKLPVGTKYYVRATDLENFVDMELSDGRRCRLAVKKSDKGWGFEIDGVYEEDCFEFIPYAG